MQADDIRLAHGLQRDHIGHLRHAHHAREQDLAARLEQRVVDPVDGVEFGAERLLIFSLESQLLAA